MMISTFVCRKCIKEKNRTKHTSPLLRHPLTYQDLVEKCSQELYSHHLWTLLYQLCHQDHLPFHCLSSSRFLFTLTKHLLPGPIQWFLLTLFPLSPHSFFQWHFWRPSLHFPGSPTPAVHPYYLYLSGWTTCTVFTAITFKTTIEVICTLMILYLE